MKKKEPPDRLTRDVLAAEAAGMSYGNYKAAHPHTPDEDDEEEIVAPPAPVERVKTGICQECGAEFTMDRHSEKKYCSDRCRVNRTQRLRYQKLHEPKNNGKITNCLVCGKDFVVSWQRRKYCSTECFTVGQRRRQKALKKQYKEEAAKNGTT